MRRRVENKSEKGMQSVVKNKKSVAIMLVLILAVLVTLVASNQEVRESIIQAFNGEIQNAEENEEFNNNTRAKVIGDKATISSAVITQRKTGTGPWDEDDEPGNDSSEDNDIVRSFDQVTWTVDLTMALKEGAGVDSIAGGTIEVKAELPENCANVMKWDIDEMSWLGGSGVVSEDGRTLTGNYTMSEETTTVPGKQTLVLVLSVEGAGNGAEIVPTVTFNLAGSEEDEKVSITGEKVIVSATGKYNIQLHSNTAYLSNKTTVDYGEGEVEGRMYGYGFTVQLYNESESKGLKGVEYPQGEISFDIDLKLERSPNGSSELEDITSEATPILWNYRANNWDGISGNIEDRDMYGSGYALYDMRLPLGIDVGDRTYSTYDSGDIQMIQEGNTLHVTINNYGFDGEFPKYNSYWKGSSINLKTKIYTDNIGTFSVGYMQIFVPDTEASTIDGMNYYLTVSDSNMQITSSIQEINTQMNASDDSIRIQHIIYKQGSYSQSISPGAESLFGKGDSKVNIEDTINMSVFFSIRETNDYDINTANKFIKFDGEAYEPIYYNDGSKYHKNGSMRGDTVFKVWYVTKKDGANWASQEEMNNGNIEDMDIYENIEDIPEGKICIGIYLETISGYISRINATSNALYFPFKIKETATIGKTYGMTQRTWYWKEQLDRSIYTITNPDVEWPKTEWDSGNRQYIKTEYDENGQMVAGTHSGGAAYGNTVLVVGANLHGNIRAVDDSNTDKINYDLGKNENIVTYSVEPQLDANENLASQIENVTLKAEVTIPKGLTYVPGSSIKGEESFAEPEITENEDGSITLVWYIYGVTSGQTIEPILFDAQISNNSSNNTQYEATLVVSEEIGEGETPKIGNSEISFRTSSTAINIINLSSYRLYKETQTQVAEANGELKYKITYQNNADTSVPDFQIIDILPYNGDGRGTEYSGNYTLKDVNVTQIGEEGEEIGTENLSLYTTTSADARNISPKDESIGVSEIWQEKEIGETINEEVTVVALKGEVGKNTEIEIDITLQTANNKGGDKYYNVATAQISKDTEEITTTSIKSEIVKRQIEGMIWYDTNENGIKDAEESYANRIEVELKKADGSKAVDINGNEIPNTITDSNGEYVFSNLPMGEYIVKIQTGEEYTVTQANVGSNKEINSKFEETEEGEKQSYVITNLNGIQSPEIIEANVNAGLVVKDAKIIVKYLEEDETAETDEDNTVLKEQEEITTYEKDGVDVKYKIGDSYTTEAVDIADYIPLRNSGNISGTLNGEETIVTYYYTYNKQSMEITKIWEDEGNRYEKRPESIHVEIKNGDVVVKEQEVAGEDGTNTWTYTFTGLDKYDVNGEEIEYTVDEKELVGEAQLYYTKEITGTTITNRMTRVPGTVTVKYIDKYTGEEIDDRVEKDGVIGTKYDVTEDKKEIAGYTLIEEPEEKEGTYTEEPQEKIYYYAKNTNVIVKYLEKDETESNADNTVVAEEVRIEGYEGKEYTTEEKTVPNYTFVEVDGETEGTMTSKSIEVIYYYAPNTKVMVKYLEQDNTPENNEDNILLATEEIEGYAGKEYTTEEKVIEGYTFVKATENTKGIMTKDTIEVIYYYAPNTKVIVKYLEQDNTPENNNDNKVLKPETTIEGYVGKEYTTQEEVIEGYTFVEATENTKGTMTKEIIEVIYYYVQNTKLTVQHIDRETGEILKEEIETGKVGDIVETKAEAFEGYVLVESPEEPNVILDETGEQIVKYYYAHISEGVIEKHIDVITGELLYSEEHKGNEGDSYTILSKEFEGYDLVESKLPENAEGEMTKEIIEVNYYYIKKASVRVQYLEKDDTPNDDTDNKVIAKEEIINGHENDNYETKAKEINNYVLVETPENATGKMEVKINEDGSYETETIVRYYYVKQAGGVIEKHIDIDSGEILEEEKHEGKVGDKYEIPAREIEGYVLVKEDEEGNSKLPTNAKGEMTEEGIEVIYYYEKLATVKVEYIDKYTGEIIEEEKIEGCVGEEYETTEKEFEGYDLVEKPTNNKGEMTKEEIVVKYYYLRKTEVEIQYIEKETGYMIAEVERIEGHEGEKYETTEKEIEYYNFIEKTENYKGEMTREKIIVTYYYEKKTFNLAIDKWISGASIDGVAQIGQSYGTRDELYKIDIHGKRTETANVKVTYKIRVTNTGEIEGTASKITEVIPEGFSYQEEDNKINWKTENGIIVTDVLKDETIKPGESKEIEIVLRWNKGEGNFGEKRNTVIISGVTNPAKYVDMNEEDNSDKSEMLMTIETGGLDSRDRTIVAIVSVQGLIVVAVGILFGRKTKKQKRN